MKTELDHDATAYTDEKIEYDLQSVDEQIVVDKKLDTQLHPEEFQFTWRSSIVGSLLGCLVGKGILWFALLYRSLTLNE